MTKRELAEEIRAMGRPTPEPEPIGVRMAASVVAGFVVARWQAAGITGYRLDGERRPVPVPATLAHDVVEAKTTSPSGKTLFRCWLCGKGPSPIPPRGVCGGELLCFAGDEIARLLLRGVLYAPREAGGLPLPLALGEPAAGA